MKGLSDEHLMSRAAQGDLDAFAELFDRHQPALLPFLYHLSGDAAAAEDLLQETFLRLWGHRDRYDPRRPFRNWLYAVARNAALNDLRRRRGQAARFSELSEADRQRVEGTIDPHAPADPSQGMQDAVLQAALRKALQALPPDQRAAVHLREFEGRSYQDIAEVLGCSAGNARVLTHRGRSALRSALRPLLSEEAEPCPNR